MLRQWWTTTVPGLASSLSLSSTMMASWWEVCTHALHMNSIMCCCKVTLCTGVVGECIVHSLPPKPTSRSIYWRSLVWSSREREKGTSTSSTRCLLDYLQRRRRCWSWMIPANTGCVATYTSGSDLAAPTHLISLCFQSAFYNQVSGGDCARRCSQSRGWEKVQGNQRLSASHRFLKRGVHSVSSCSCL